MRKEERVQELLARIKVSADKLYHIATHDSKTGLYNNMFFSEMFEIEKSKAQRGKHLSLVVIDIDFFKKINDTYGHLEADKMLLRLAGLFERESRRYDLVSRFGGEEFLILLPNTPLVKAKRVAERIRLAVLKDSFLKKYGVTISLGVSEFKEKDNFKKLASRADRALYQAKKSGRNRVCV